MALEATHLRFAFDLESRLAVSDRGLYFAGAVYPDSRYTTGIHRNLTHGDTVPKDPFAEGLDDFQKGWATHVFYDEHTLQKYKDLSPWPDQRVESFGDLWVFTTAIKLIEDLQSYDLIKDKNLFGTLKTPPPPNHEDVRLLEKYYEMQKRLYSKKPDLDDYLKILASWNIPEDVQLRFADKVRALRLDPDLEKRTSAIFPAVCSEIEKRS